jgi:NAD(P)-dependent dehydrogenase (short-subunit alcohol dehydrogenase family)
MTDTKVGSERRSDFRLDGKVAVITGATGTMGSEFSRTLAGAGASVVLIGRTQLKLDALAEDINAAGGKAARHVCDLSVREQAAALGEVVVPIFGGVDVVLHNAVPTGGEGGSDLLGTTANGWATNFDLIVWGGLEVCKSVQPSMVERGGGSIITIISSTGVNPTPGYAAYGMAKGSLLLMTKYMAKEWGPFNIRANSLNPGSIASPGGEDQMQRMVERLGIADRISMRRVGRLHEVLGTALFLASDASSYISGQVINIDGGRI